MSKAGVCCDDCFDRIANLNTGAAKWWLNLCELEHSFGIFGIATDDNLEFQLLEEMRFITTTDSSDMIVVKVHGKRIDSQGAYFCGGNCHE